jgi:hypothetical protein
MKRERTGGFMSKFIAQLLGVLALSSLPGSMATVRAPAIRPEVASLTRKRESVMTFRSFVSLLCGGLLLVAGATSISASEFKGPVSFAQAATNSTRAPSRCTLDQKTKKCGGTCPNKSQKCRVYYAPNICTCM